MQIRFVIFCPVIKAVVNNERINTCVVCAQGQRHSCLTSIWNRPSSHFDTSAIMACLGHVSNISSSQIATGENPRTKPCRPAMASICSQDNTTELTLPDGLWDILTVCMKNAFDSWAITHRECVIMMYGNFLVDTCLPLPG